MMAEFAQVLNKPADVTEYVNLSDDIRLAISKEFYKSSTGEFRNGTQTAQAMALWSGIPSGADEDKALEALLRAIEKKDHHISTGIFGTKMMFDVLRERDMNEVAYRVADQRGFPGWGHMVESGATTLWETWRYSDNTFSEPPHVRFGRRVVLPFAAGHQRRSTGFPQDHHQTATRGDLTSAKGHIMSMYGKISSSWHIRNGVFTLAAGIPANTTAEIYVPLKWGGAIKESGKSIQPQRTEKGYAVFAIGSGDYIFTTALTKP